jgi:transposase InsO family protein
MIILNVDASTSIGWGAILSQLQSDGKVRPARFESGIWSPTELKYDAVKLECRGLLKALKKFRFWLYGRYFTIETDAQTLVWLLNQPPNDLPNAMMTRWLAYIRLFDFHVKHIPGTKNGGADALSRRGPGPQDSPEDEDEADDYFDAKLYSIQASDRSSDRSLYSPTARVYLHEADYDGDDLTLGHYLETLQRPEGMTDQQFQQLRKKSRTFLGRDGHLFKRSRKHGIPPRRVIGKLEQRQEILSELHDETGHRGRRGTYDQLHRRYQWKEMYNDVVNYVKTCEECQRRSRVRQEEPLHPTWSMLVWEKVGIDIVYMPWTAKEDGFGFIVFARDDLSGWVEGRAIKAADSKNVAKFIYEDVICRHGCPRRIVLDRGSENLNLTKDLLEHYRIKRTVISAYHPQANGLVERGHDSIVNSLSKYCSKKPQDWEKYLPLALWADRVSVRRSTGYSAFELVYGRDCLLPIDFTLESWSVVDWEGEVKTREDLLTARMRQLDQKVLTEVQAAENLRNSRNANKTYYDQHKQLRSEAQQLHVGDFVLLHRTKASYSRSQAHKTLRGLKCVWNVLISNYAHPLHTLNTPLNV